MLKKSKSVLDGEIFTDVIPNLDGEFLPDTDGWFDFNWGIFDGEWWTDTFDFIPSFNDGELSLNWAPGFDGESNFMPSFDGEFASLM